MRLNKHLFTSLLLVVCAAFFAGGCQTIARKAGYEKIEVATQKIEQARQESQKKIDDLKAQHVTELNSLVDLKDSNAQKAAGDLYGAIIAYETIPEPTRTENVMGLRTKSAYARLPAPSSEQLLKEMEEVKKELSEALTSNEDLKKKYKEKEQEAIKAKNEIDAKAQQIEKIQKDIQTAKDEAAAKERELQDIRSKLQQEQLAREQKAADDQARIHKEKMWIIGTLTFAALASAAAAIFLPVPGMKKNLFLFAGICMAIAVAVPFIKMWMVVVTFAVCAVIFGAPLLRNYYLEYKDATATYRAIQRNKERDPNGFKAGLAVDLAQWHSTYKKDKSGNTVVVPDTSVSKRIDQRLIETEEK
jgi:chemotaxis protein histidine kinase CheA